MKRMTIMAAGLAASLAGAAAAQEAIRHFPAGSRPSGKGPQAYFSGSVRVDPKFAASDQTPLSIGEPTFEPGARSAWHTHPAGQLLIITSGKGWVQEVGGPKREVKTGDVIWIPAGIKHWHGATATTGMSHFAIQNSIDGKNVDWMEKVRRGFRQMRRQIAACAVLGLLLGASEAAGQAVPERYVRLAELEIDPAQRDRFVAAVKEEIEASIRDEPGVLMLNAVVLKDEPSRVRVFEMYVDEAAYAAHLRTPHFLKFKAETQEIVLSLKLFDAIPLALGSK